MTLAEAQTWRDSILTEMGRLTKAPGTSGSGAIRSDGEQRQAVLAMQLLEARRMIAALTAPAVIKIGGYDDDDPSQS